MGLGHGVPRLSWLPAMAAAGWHPTALEGDKQQLLAVLQRRGEDDAKAPPPANARLQQ